MSLGADALGMRETDVWFQDSPDEGDPACFCSRCHFPIRSKAIRVFDRFNNLERRYHVECLHGVKVADLVGEEEI